MAKLPTNNKPEFSELGARIGFRAGGPEFVVTNQLGPLAELAGTWAGTGLNLISLPKRKGNQPPLMLNTTFETLQFTPIGGQVRNRGSGNDIYIAGLTYFQRVSDAVTKEPLHIESGLWLNVPATVDPVQPETVVRQATIANGVSLLAQGSALVVAGGPRIGIADPRPTGPNITADDLTVFVNPPLPPGFKLPFVGNPNLALQEALREQNITKTVVLIVSTAPAGGIVNIPFVVQHANATKLDAILWIESVQRPDGGTFMQLQYTQTVLLNFRGIDWPHISVATLIKQ